VVEESHEHVVPCLDGVALAESRLVYGTRTVAQTADPNRPNPAKSPAIGPGKGTSAFIPAPIPPDHVRPQTTKPPR
jgi:hypothetical protein